MIVRSTDRFISESGQPKEVSVNVPGTPSGTPRIIASGSGTIDAFPAQLFFGPFARLPGERCWVVLYIATTPVVGIDSAVSWNDAFPTACVWGLCFRVDPDDTTVVRVAIGNNTAFQQDYEWSLLGIVPP